MDKNMLQGLDGVPEEDQRRMAAVIDQLQVRDSQSCAYVAFGRFGKNTPIPKLGILFMCEHLCMRMYNSVVERCFNDCVDNFTRKSLQKQEETCVMRCAEKFLKHSMRVGLRFAELNNLAATPDQSS